MSDDLYLLSKDDIELLRQLVRAFKQAPRNTRNRLAQEDELGTTPEVYVAYTPPAGIPALGQVGTGTGSSVIGPEVTPGSAKCPVYQLIDSSGSPKIVKTGFNLQTVYNFSTVAVAGDSWILAVRDKFGAWIAVQIAEFPETGMLVPTSTSLQYLPIQVPAIQGSGTRNMPVYACSLYMPGVWTSGFGKAWLYDSTSYDSLIAGWGDQILPPTVGMPYICKFYGKDSNGIPIYQWSSPVASITTRGDVTTGHQYFRGIKTFTYPGPDESDTGTGTGINTLSVINAIGGIGIGPRSGLVYPPSNYFTGGATAYLTCPNTDPLTGPELVISVAGRTGGAATPGMSSIMLDAAGDIYLGSPLGVPFPGNESGAGVTTNLFVTAGGLTYQGATGTDGSGSIFVSGVCVLVGGGITGGVDGGSYW